MIPMLFSVSYAGFWGQHRLDLPAFLQKARALGYPSVELMGKRPHLSVLDTDRQTVEELRKTAADLGLEIATVAAYTNFTLGRDSEVPGVEMQVEYVRRLAGLAEGLGAKIVRIFTGYLVQTDGFQRDWEMCVAAVRECATVAADHGVVIGLQNHHDVGIGVDSYLEFLDDVDHPNCRAMFDPWAPALHGDDLQACARRLAPRMVQTTLADYIRLPRYQYMPGLVNYRRLDDAVRAVPLGEGFVDLPGFFAGLKEGGFKGYVSYEMCSPVRGGGSEENLDRTARESLETIRRLTAKG
jgi:sugar phosphate isomerase/epimerase